jgi:hypothetical protein
VSDHDRIIKAADDAEVLSRQLHDVAEELKTGLEAGSVNYAYARLYHIRTDLGRIVARLGVGVPKRIQQ